MRRFDQRRERNTPRYKRMRRLFLAENPLCAVCAKAGKTVSADEIDHVIPVRKAPQHFWKGWQAICRPCHEIKTAQENTVRTIPGRSEWISHASRFD